MGDIRKGIATHSSPPKKHTKKYLRYLFSVHIFFTVYSIRSIQKPEADY
jgi:hypothetical protein